LTAPLPRAYPYPMRTEEATRGRKRRAWRWVGLGTGAAALLVALAGAGYWHVSAQARVGEYRARAELLAWTFQDRVSFDLKQGNQQDLEFLTGTLVLGNVLYAQIVVDGEVLAEVNRLGEPLPPAASGEAGGGGLTIERRVTAQGRAYWDIRRALPDRQGYVRLGLSLEPLERELRAQLWLTLGVGTGAVALVGLLLAMFFLRPRPPSAIPAAPAAEPPPGAPPQGPSQGAVPTRWQRVGDLAIDEEGKRVTVGGEPVELSPKEFELLALLASEPGRVFSSEEILKRVWANSHYATSQDVKQYIYFLRQKLEEDPRNPRRIVTVRGFGYKLQG